MHLVAVAFLATWLGLTQGNLEGPFLFFGPKSLEHYKRTALKYLQQDDLMKIYGEQAAIVVFNNQDSVPLSSENFPRLRKMLEGQGMLVLPQDFLDVHPDYVSNDTQVLMLQGPWSERDAQMTETFARLQDIYGAGRVLGVLGNSVSQKDYVEKESVVQKDYVDKESVVQKDYVEKESVVQKDYGDREWNRLKRDAIQEPGSTQMLITVEDEKPAKTSATFALYNATGPPGKAALLYSSEFPELQWPDGSLTILDTPIGEPTIKPTRLYTILVVRFSDGDNIRDKITLEFSFKQSAGWWVAAGVEVRRGREPGIGLLPPSGSTLPTAILGFAYHCPQPLIYSAVNATLVFPNIRMQPFMANTQRFSDAIDCIGFTTAPICAGLLATFITGLSVFLSILMIMDINSMPIFNNSQGKQLTITISE